MCSKGLAHTIQKVNTTFGSIKKMSFCLQFPTAWMLAFSRPWSSIRKDSHHLFAFPSWKRENSRSLFLFVLFSIIFFSWIFVNLCSKNSLPDLENFNQYIIASLLSSEGEKSSILPIYLWNIQCLAYTHQAPCKLV